MLFAFLDYWQFRSKGGRYDRRNPANPLAIGWDDQIPSHVLDALEDGDMLLMVSFDSVLSWLIAYSTSSYSSHAALYCEGRRVAHMTKGGYQVHSIDYLFQKGSRYLPIKVSLPQRRGRVEDLTAQFAEEPYGWGVVLQKATSIFSGRAWPLYKMEFFFDFLLVLLLFEAVTVIAFGQIVFLWLACAYLALLFANAIRWRWQPLPPERYAFPDMVLNFGSGALGDAYSWRKDLAPDASLVVETSKSNLKESD